MLQMVAIFWAEAFLALNIPEVQSCAVSKTGASRRASLWPCIQPHGERAPWPPTTLSGSRWLLRPTGARMSATGCSRRREKYGCQGCSGLSCPLPPHRFHQAGPPSRPQCPGGASQMVVSPWIPWELLKLQILTQQARDRFWDLRFQTGSQWCRRSWPTDPCRSRCGQGWEVRGGHGRGGNAKSV